MLLTRVANSRARLQRVYEAESRYFNGRDMAEIVPTKLDEFKAVTRYVTDCERAWRHALLLFEKAQRRRERESKVAATSTARPAIHRNVPPALPTGAPDTTAAYAHRE